MGHFDKTVSIKLAGVDNPKVVGISGEVLSQTDYDAAAKDQGNKPKTEANTTTQPDNIKSTGSKTKSKSGK